MSRERRLEENQEVFQRANGRLVEMVEGGVSADTLIPFLCECADRRCLGTVPLTVADYEELHENGDRYVILPGHAMAEQERVVADRGALLVTEK